MLDIFRKVWYNKGTKLRERVMKKLFKALKKIFKRHKRNLSKMDKEMDDIFAILDSI